MDIRPYTRDELRRVGALFHRISHLIERTRHKPHLTYDLQEISSILWVVEELVEWRGPLPDDLALVLASLRADVPRKSTTPST